MENGWASVERPDGGKDDYAAALYRLALVLDTDLKTLLGLLAARNETAPHIAALARRAEAKLGEAGELLDEICASLGACRPRGSGSKPAAPSMAAPVSRPPPWRADPLPELAGEPDVTAVRARYARLTAREKEVFRLMTAHNIDTSSKGIARRLQISPRTVECHRARIMKKMAARSVAELVTMAGICGVSPLLLGFGLATAVRSASRDDAALRRASALLSAAAPLA